eukprot:1495637-Rhodomonas_salina.2
MEHKHSQRAAHSRIEPAAPPFCAGFQHFLSGNTVESANFHDVQLPRCVENRSRVMAAVPDAPAHHGACASMSAAQPRPSKRLRIVLFCGACVMALGAVMALVGGLNEEDDGQQRLSLEESAVGLGKMQEQLKEDSSRLKSVVSLFDKVKQEQSELKVKEDDLKNKETSIRSAVHEARNSVVALKYKIHNMKTEAFSNQMFSDSEQRRKDAEQRL